MSDATRLNSFTDEQLQEELGRREEVAKQETIPKQLEGINLNPLRKACQDYIDAVATSGDADFDLKQRIFVAAMVAFFGIGSVGWINSNARSQRTYRQE